MPVMDGIIATKKIREFLSDELDLEIADQPKILGVTGHVEDDFR